MLRAPMASYMQAQWPHCGCEALEFTKRVSVGDEDKVMLPKAVKDAQIPKARGGSSSNWLVSADSSMASRPDPLRILGLVDLSGGLVRSAGRVDTNWCPR